MWKMKISGLKMSAAGSCCLIGVFLLVGSIEALGEPSGDKVQGSAYISIVAVGPKPKNRFELPGKKEMQELRDELGDGEIEGVKVNRSDHAGIPIPLPPLAGMTPPSSLYMRKVDSKDSDPEWSRLRVGFNGSTAITKVSSGIGLTLYSRHQKGDLRYKPYLKLPELSPGSQMMVFLLPSGKGKRPWLKEPKVSELHLHSKGLRGKNLLFRNYASQTVAIAMGEGKPIILRTGQRRSRKLDRDAGYQRVSAVTGGKNKESLLNTTVRVSEGDLTVIVFYDANPETNAGKAVGVFRVAVKKQPVEVTNSD